MKIYYTQKRLNISRFAAWGYLLLGLVIILLSLILSKWHLYVPNFMGIGFVIVGIGYLAVYLYEKRNQYITIENGILTKHSIFPKHLNLDAIEHIKEFAGDLKLKTQNSELVIDTKIIEKDSLEDLRKVLENLNLPINTIKPV